MINRDTVDSGNPVQKLHYIMQKRMSWSSTNFKIRNHQIPVLLQIYRTARDAEKKINSVSRDVFLISKDVKSIVKSVHRQVYLVGDGIENVHDMAVLVKDFRLEVKKRRIEEPLLQIALVLGGVKRGVEIISGSGIFCH